MKNELYFYKCPNCGTKVYTHDIVYIECGECNYMLELEDDYAADDYAADDYIDDLDIDLM